MKKLGKSVLQSPELTTHTYEITNSARRRKVIQKFVYDELIGPFPTQEASVSIQMLYNEIKVHCFDRGKISKIIIQLPTQVAGMAPSYNLRVNYFRKQTRKKIIRNLDNFGIKHKLSIDDLNESIIEFSMTNKLIDGMEKMM